MPGDGPVAPLPVNALLVSTSLVVGLPVEPPATVLAAVKPFAELLDMLEMLGALKLVGVAPPLLEAAPPVEAPPPVVEPPPVAAPLLVPLLNTLLKALLVLLILAPVDPEAPAVDVEAAGTAFFALEVEEPPAEALMTIWPNCSGVLSRLNKSIGNWIDWLLGAGGWPTWPTATGTLWSRIELVTSMAVRFRAANFWGSSQTRML